MHAERRRPARRLPVLGQHRTHATRRPILEQPPAGAGALHYVGSLGAIEEDAPLMLAAGDGPVRGDRPVGIESVRFEVGHHKLCDEGVALVGGMTVP